MKKIEKLSTNTEILFLLKDIIIKINYNFKDGNNEEVEKNISLLKTELLSIDNLNDFLFLLNGINNIISNEIIKDRLISILHNFYDKKLKISSNDEIGDSIKTVIESIESILGN